MTSQYKVFSGEASQGLAQKICKHLNCPLGKLSITHFSDGEFGVSYEESIRGQIVFIVRKPSF
jgi:ribose-phosphate pyrophosphokinase